MALLTTNGQPDDSVGVAGDYALDANHFLWGPKTTTWAGTASSTVGPSGPALLSGKGAPPSGTGAVGQCYLDTLTGNLYGPKQGSSAWGTPASNIAGPSGPQGAAGPTYLTGMSAAVGAYAVANSVALSATPYVMTLPGTTMASTFTPLSPSALMGLYCYSSVASTITLYDATASTAVYSKAMAAAQSFTSGYFDTTTYPLIQGHTYQWQVTGAATALVQLEPFYLSPANSPGLNVGMAGPAGFSAAQTFSATAVSLPPLGLTTAFGIYAHTPPRTAGIYSAQATYTPSAGTAATASVQLALNYGPLAGGTGGVVGVTVNPVTATGLPQTIIAPHFNDLSSLTSGFYFYWKATGTGTGTLSVTLYPFV